MSDDFPVSVYRFYDAADRLLYIGMAIDPDSREYGHRSSSTWYPEAVRREVEWYASQKEAFDAEREAIRQESPAHNKMRYSDASVVVTTWRAPDELHEQLRRQAFESRRPMNDLISEAVREWLNRREPKGNRES